MKIQRSFLLLLAALCCLSLSMCVKEAKIGNIQGIVTNSSNNEPVQGVNISLSPLGLSAVTGSDGRYEFKNIGVGQYTVQAVKTGFETNTKNITIVEGNVSSGDMVLKPEIASFSLNVDYLDFGTAFSQMSFKIINTSSSLSINWSITENLNWLSVTPSSGDLAAGQQAAVEVSINRSLIEQSTSANLSIKAGDLNVMLPISVSVSGSDGPRLQLSETSLDFGSSANSLAFYVMNTGPAGTSLNWACSNVSVEWLSLSPTSGNTDGGSSTPVLVTIDRSKFSGNVSTSLNISGAGSSVSLSVSASEGGSGAPILQLSEGSLDFGSDKTTLTFQVKNVGAQGTVLDWSIPAPTVNWMTIAPLSGHTNAGSSTTVTVAVDRNNFTGLVSETINVNSSSNSSSVSVSAANVHAEMQLSVTTFDFGTNSDTKTFTVKNVGEAGSMLQWSIATPEVDWLTASPMSGSLAANASKTVTLKIDRNAFVGDLTTQLSIMDGDHTETLSVSANNSVIVTDGLAAYYTFDQQNADDWYGQYNGYIVSGINFVSNTPSGEGYAARFSSATDQIRVPNNPGVMYGFSSFSVSFWISMNGASGSIFSYVKDQGTEYQGHYCWIYPQSNGDLSYYYAHGCKLTFTTPSFLYNGGWHHVVLLSAKNSATLYVDGIKYDTFSFNGCNPLDFKLVLGAVTGTSYYNANSFIGNMDNLRIYNRVLTQEEIRALFDNKQ